MLYAVKLGADPFTVGLLAGMFSLFPILVAVPGGKLSDRFGSRWIITFGAMFSTLGMLVPYFSPGLIAFFIAAAMYGIFDGVHLVSIQNMVGVLSKPEERTKNFSNLSVVFSVSASVGPLIAGISIDHFGHENACLLGATLASIPFFLLLTRGAILPRGTREAKKAEATTLAMLWEPAVRGLLIVGALYQTGNTLFQVYMPVYSNSAGLSATAIGIVLSMNAAATFIMRLSLPRLVTRFKEEKMLPVVFFVSATGLLLIPFFKDVWSLTLLSFLFGLGMGCGGPIIQVIMFNNAPKGRSAEVLGLRMSVNHASKMISPVLFGAIASGFGFLSMFWTSAALMGIGGMLSPKDSYGKTDDAAQKQKT